MSSGLTAAVERLRMAAAWPRPGWPAATAGALFGAIGACAILATLGWGVYRSRFAPFRAPVVTVDGQSQPMRYLIARVALSGGEPLTTLDTLAREQIMLADASRPPFQLTITADDIDAYLRHQAIAAGVDGSDLSYRAWRRQLVNESVMSEDEFQHTIRVRLLRGRMAEQLAAGLPAALPQVRLEMISTRSLDDAEALSRRVRAGEDFGAMAADRAGHAQPGDAAPGTDWVPRAALPNSLAAVVFDQLRVGEVSAPLARADAPGFLLVRVNDRSDRHPLSPDARRRTGLRLLDERLDHEYQRHDIILAGLVGGYDSATDAWVREQVRRRREPSAD